MDTRYSLTNSYPVKSPTTTHSSVTNVTDDPSPYEYSNKSHSSRAYMPDDPSPYQIFDKTQTPKPHRPAHFYLPVVLRLPSLALLFIFTLALIAGLEYGIRTLPHDNKGGLTKMSQAKRSINHYIRPRAESNSVSLNGIAPVLPSPASTTVTDVYLPTKIVSIELRAETDPPVAATTPVVPTATTAPGGYLPTQISTVDVSANAPSNSFISSYGPAGTRTDAYLPTTVSGTDISIVINPITGTPNPSAYLPTIVTGTDASGAPLFSTISDGYLPTKVSGTDTTNSPITVSTSIAVPTSVTTSVPVTKVTTDAAGNFITQVTFVPTTSTGITLVPTVIGVINNPQIEGGSEFVPDSFPLWWIFATTYLPILISVIIKEYWSAIAYQTKVIEPFIRLQAASGVHANSVLDVFYLSSRFTSDVFLALTRKHWFILWTSMVFYAICLTSPLSSELVFLDINYPNCPGRLLTEAGKLNPCWPPIIAINPIIARIIEGLLIFSAIMTLVLMAMLFRVKSGVYSDPSSIACIISMIHHPEVVRDFTELPAEASMNEISNLLQDKMYKLDEYQRSDGTWRYGLVPVAPSYQRLELSPPTLREIKPRHRKWKIIDLILDSVFLLCILGLLGIVVAYFKDSKDDAFNRFFNSHRFGPSFTLTTIGSLIALNLNRICHECHTLSAYYSMSQAPTEAKRSILFRKCSLPITAIFPSLLTGHFFVAFLAVCALLSEFLVVFLGSVPFQEAQVYVQLLVGSYASMGLLGLMAICCIFLILWKRKMPDLPRAPDTIAAVATYVADSRMTGDFQGFEYYDNAEMKNQLSHTGKRYVYGSRIGLQGHFRYLVDEDTQLA